MKKKENVRITVPLNPHQSDIGNRCRHGQQIRAAPRRVALRQPLGNLSRSCVALHGPASYFRCPHGKRNATPTRPRHPVTRCAASLPSPYLSLCRLPRKRRQPATTSARGSSLGALTGGAAARRRSLSLSHSPHPPFLARAGETDREAETPH